MLSRYAVSECSPATAPQLPDWDNNDASRIGISFQQDDTSIDAFQSFMDMPTDVSPSNHSPSLDDL